MQLNNWAFIYLGTGIENPDVDRAVIEAGGLRTTIVAVPEASRVVNVAVDLVRHGAQTIELCGAFGPTWTARVIEATGGVVPVGSVNYGQESIAALVELVGRGPEPALAQAGD